MNREDEMPRGWAYDRWESGKYRTIADKLRSLPLLYLHNLLTGLDRRLAESLDDRDVEEEAQENYRSCFWLDGSPRREGLIRHFSQVLADNYRALFDVTVEKEKEEIERLIRAFGRAA